MAITIVRMQFEAERAYLLANFQEYRIIQPTVIFLHGLPTALSRKNTLATELQRIGVALRVNIQTAGKDFFTAFVEFEREVPAALAIMALDGMHLMNRTLRVFYGSTKFCPHYLKGHGCRLQDCNYAHYFHHALTHLKDQAKDIDHRSIAAMFLSQDCSATQSALSLMTRPNAARKFILPIDADVLARQFGLGEAVCLAVELKEDETEGRETGDGVDAFVRGDKPGVAVQEQWGIISRQIEREVSVSGQPVQKVKRSRIQQFLDGAERFLSKLIFQSSDFIF